MNRAETTKLLHLETSCCHMKRLLCYVVYVDANLLICIDLPIQYHRRWSAPKQSSDS